MVKVFTTQETIQKVEMEKHSVYAKPFIPEDWKRINKEPGVVHETPSRHFIDYALYVRTFAGCSFLPHRIPFTAHNPSSLSSSGELRADNYLGHFAAVWRTEIAAQEAQNEDFSLYKIFAPKVWPGGRNRTQHVLFSISVPGLREETPHVELGDVIELRQLYVDHFGNFLQQNGTYSRLWTGMVFHACVYGIHRAEETVYLRIDALQDIHHPNAAFPTLLPIVVNAVFPLRKRTINSCRDALVFVHNALKMTLENKTQSNGHARYIDSHQQLAKDMKNLAVTDGRPADQTAQRNGDGFGAEQNEWMRRMLFPVESDGKIQSELRKIPQRPLFDSAINYEQAHAVNSVCTDAYGCVPYLISGPPGTGKTKTIVEIAMQLLNSHITDHILICAPSESAADTLALRLSAYLNPKQLLRLNGPWRADNEVPSSLMQHTYLEDDMFSLPPFKQIMAYNIVVTSCRDAAILAEARLTNTDLWFLEKNMLEAFHPETPPPPPALHWGALLLDEAAQGTELDVLPPLSTVCPPPSYPSTMPLPSFILAGDEKQLGPKTASHDPQFSRSLFARLSLLPPYASHPLSRSNTKPSSGPPVLKKSMLPLPYPPFTNLTRNYRSHPAILSVPSSLFYADTLIPEAPTPSTPLQNSALWPRANWPVLFIPHTHEEDIERDGGGWFNAREAHLACETAAHFIRHDAVAPSDIAVISPFAAQVRRIRAVMRGQDFGFWDVSIGPLEAFQGLEKRVVIIATTRTRRGRFVEGDVEKGLGLIGSPQRMNVAVTRAREGLVVLGSADALREDGSWGAFLAFCGRNGLVRGGGGGGTEYGGAGEARIGVLEKALLAKEMRKANGRGGRVLGGGAMRLEDNYDGDYEAWVESLREAMDEDGEEDEDEVEDGDDD
ncbi:hypothetical protein GRF29_44g2348413 [Pseudopithomyces chartarum]|uniref:RNA helicase n=1 Tax=Pseudopithomyces chartarum TaxID=1892770 RepID=A0AAN6M325_9PLEO|nr:hypothetical protein GRF29_44g2348413 [Pseudopithomyces chartarum]